MRSLIFVEEYLAISVNTCSVCSPKSGAASNLFPEVLENLRGELTTGTGSIRLWGTFTIVFLWSIWGSFTT